MLEPFFHNLSLANLSFNILCSLFLKNSFRHKISWGSYPVKCHFFIIFICKVIFSIFLWNSIGWKQRWNSLSLRNFIRYRPGLGQCTAFTLLVEDISGSASPTTNNLQPWVYRVHVLFSSLCFVYSLRPVLSLTNILDGS